jgi:allantoinase
VHFNEPGRTEWEGFASGSAALAAGGGTFFIEMPLNASPPTLDAGSFDLKRSAAEAHSLVDFALWGGLTPINLDQMPALAERGVAGFKAFMCDSGITDFPRADDPTLKRGMQIAKEFGLLVAVHAENQELTARLARQMTGKTWKDFLASRPIEAETSAIYRAIELAGETGCSLHIVHVSSAAGVELVREAREKAGLDVTCETCPHYLLLCEEDLMRLGAKAKCAPPLRSRTERARLWELLKSGAIEFVASDHSPAPASMKTGDDVTKIWGGIAGVQSTLMSLLGELSPNRIAEVTAERVAARFGISRKGKIAVGYDADLVLVDLDATTRLQEDDLLDRNRSSPYVGREFRGAIRRTIACGKTIFHDGKITKGCAARLITPQHGRQP